MYDNHVYLGLIDLVGTHTCASHILSYETRQDRREIIGLFLFLFHLHAVSAVVVVVRLCLNSFIAFALHCKADGREFGRRKREKRIGR